MPTFSFLSAPALPEFLIHHRFWAMVFRYASFPFSHPIIPLYSPYIYSCMFFLFSVFFFIFHLSCFRVLVTNDMIIYFKQFPNILCPSPFSLVSIYPHSSQSTHVLYQISVITCITSFFLMFFPLFHFPLPFPCFSIIMS
ncbi:hypothetical protein I7I53_07621 [Histoplasma capsulatum var. duboisii H88]|uniref:Uncharacterized protein n=1 Tax=Ajellomyces capsulatus (strain H88) TaxID=544711 RepID=A0A8A1LCH5_AJEC8|nr:hypothetical protein I7I53_07621 [Histoplasma capsulatum var. duboisii H88]